MRTMPNGEVLSKGARLTEHDYGKHAPHILAKFEHMLRNDGQIPVAMQTKKFAQRVIPERWGPGGPNITATSLADDYVHFSQPRVPTVREWARIQTFPDWYQFAGKRTTGGRHGRATRRSVTGRGRFRSTHRLATPCQFSLARRLEST